MEHAAWMQRCLQLAAHGAGTAAPNPMVGAVLAQGDRLLAEGWHQAPGGPHAEVNCLNNFGNGPVPADAAMYVSLEPCAHTGLTPPCTDLLIRRGVRTVVVGCADPDPRVSGQGIARLQAAGVKVISDVLRDQSRWLNRRFITAMEHRRPYIILKWARSSDGFLDHQPRDGRGVQRISTFATDVLVHRWRSEEQAILAGSRTVLNDNPSLTVRHVAGRSPLRLVLDRQGITPADSKIYDGHAPTLLFTGTGRPGLEVEQVLLAPDADPLTSILDELHRRQVRSVLVEGGAELLGHFIRRGLWDEAREIVGEVLFLRGTPAPRMEVLPERTLQLGTDRIHGHVRNATPQAAWAW